MTVTERQSKMDRDLRTMGERLTEAEMRGDPAPAQLARYPGRLQSIVVSTATGRGTEGERGGRAENEGRNRRTGA